MCPVSTTVNARSFDLDASRSFDVQIGLLLGFARAKSAEQQPSVTSIPPHPTVDIVRCSTPRKKSVHVIFSVISFFLTLFRERAKERQDEKR